MKNKILTPAGYVSPDTLTAAETGKTLLVGFSGGADSTALLDILANWGKEHGIEIHAAHVNHGIRGDEAIRDREFCRAFCEERGIRFHCLDADVPGSRQSGESMETAARRIRYAYFEELMRAEGIPMLALAHNADDNLETLLFRIGRGTGMRGLCGIPQSRPFGGGTLIRPLLYVSRAEILRYCEREGLSFVTDSTNLLLDASRNRIRHEVIPALCAAVGDPVAAAARLVRHISESEDYLEEKVDSLIAWMNAACDIGADALPCCWDVAHPRVLSRNVLNGEHRAIASRAVTRLLETAGADPGAVHIDAILAFSRSDAAHGTLSLPGNYLVRATYDRLTVEKKEGSSGTAPGSGSTEGSREDLSEGSSGAATGTETKAETEVSAGAGAEAVTEATAATDVTAEMASGGRVPLIPGQTVTCGPFTVTTEVMTYREMCGRYGADAFSREENPLPSRDILARLNVYNLSISVPMKSDIIKNEVFLRTRQKNDKIIANGLHKDVRRLISARHIPFAAREALPLICDSEGVLAIPYVAARDGSYPGHGTDEECDIWLVSVTFREGSAGGSSAGDEV